MAAAAAAELPRGFGVARSVDTGTSSHELIYEHEYSPAPIRKYSSTVPPDVACTETLRPCVRNSRVAFRFFGARVPLTADHGRCWMGGLLTGEVRTGRLRAVELLVPSLETLPDLLAQVQSVQPYSLPPSWQWLTWPWQSRSTDEPPVTVTMSCSPHDGVAIRLAGDSAHARALVYRVLRQYCDEVDAKHWHPIPETPKAISKVHHGQRATLGATLSRVRAGEPGTMAHENTCVRHLGMGNQADLRVVQALSRAKVAPDATANVYDHLVCLREVDKALHAALEARLRPRPEWRTVTTQVVESFIRRVLAQKQPELERLQEARELAIRFQHDYDADLPESLGEAEKVLGGAAGPLRGEALRCLNKTTAGAAASAAAVSAR